LHTLAKRIIVLLLVAAAIATLIVVCSSTTSDEAALPPDPVVVTQPSQEEDHTKKTDGVESTPVVTDEPQFLHSDAIPLPFELQDVMQEACDKYGVPYALALAVAESESDFDLEADNGTCWGVMQIHPINYDRLRENGIEPTEYEGNIVAGVFMLGELLEKYSDTHKALMAYNCGETGARRLWKQGYDTSSYSRKVVTRYEKWQQTINDNGGNYQ